VRVDGRIVSIERVLADSTLSALLSDEGPVLTPRYER
jgi:hypothetical protein